jgi:hypothetical protein
MEHWGGARTKGNMPYYHVKTQEKYIRVNVKQQVNQRVEIVR